MRSRHQAGSVQRRKHGKRKVWVGLYRDAEGSRRYVTLKDKNDVLVKTESAAKGRLAELLVPINRERAAKQITPETLLGDYIERVYIPFGKDSWKESTAATTIQRLRQHLVNGELAQTRVADLSRDTLQSFLNARGLSSYSVVNHLRWDLRAICRLAVEDGVLMRDPSTSLHTPGTTTTRIVRSMTREQIGKVICALDLRERLFCRFAIYAGMRPGEIIGLRWTSIVEGAALISQRFYKGTADKPKGRKGKDTSRDAGLPPSLLRDLEAWRGFAITEDAYLFATEKGTPVKYENLMEDFIRPRLKEIGLEWVNFQVMRRTWSSMSKAAGANPKVVADQLGHGMNVDMNEYTQSTIEQKQEAVRRFEEFVQ